MIGLMEALGIVEIRGGPLFAIDRAILSAVGLKLKVGNGFRGLRHHKLFVRMIVGGDV